MSPDITHQRTPHFYLDETVLEIDGKRHMLVASLGLDNPHVVAAEMAKLKRKFGLKITDEVKYSQPTGERKLTIKQMYEYSDGVVGLLNMNGCAALVAINEGTDKQSSAQLALQQLITYCHKNSLRKFFLHIDNDLATDTDALWLEANSDENITCLGLQECDSSKDQAIQCADIFAGLYRLAIDLVLTDRKKPIMINDQAIGQEIELPLDHYILMCTRWLIAGETTLTEDGDFNLPFKDSWNDGLTFKSSVSVSTHEKLHEQIAKVYMGCLH